MPNARTSDPTTSHEAARSVWEPTIVQQHVLDILEHEKVTGNAAGLDNDEIYQAYVRNGRLHGWVVPSPESVRSRRSELEKRGLIEFTGLYGLSASGRRTQKWGRS